MKGKYNIKITVPAIDDLYRMKFYLDGYDPSIFISIIIELELIANHLINQPYMYAMFKTLHNCVYRKVNLKKYILIYDIDDGNKVVYIDRIYHGRENYQQKFYN